MAGTPVRVRQLTCRYAGSDRAALDGVDLALHPGEILGLLGPNGAGKTTTLHAILGLLEPAAGHVEVFGHSPLRDRALVLARVNFASADVDLPSNLCAAECLRVFAGLYNVSNARHRIDALLQRFEITHLRARRVGSLSSGERMRLKLCKALLNTPDLLILDEPTLSLDPYMAQNVRTWLQAIQREQGTAILHTSHNMREVEAFCHRIVFLHRGRVLAAGAPRDVLHRLDSRSLEELFIRVASGGALYDAA